MCNKFADEIRGLSDGLMVGIRWMEKVGEGWGMGGFYVVASEEGSVQPIRRRLTRPTQSRQTPTPTSDSAVTASTTRFMEPFDCVNSTGIELPSFKDLLTNNFQVTRRPVHARGALR